MRKAKYETCKFCKLTKCAIGHYPCDDYLNQAIRLLLDAKQYGVDPVIGSAISEIVFCIHKSTGRFCDDVKQSLVKEGFLMKGEEE